MQCQNVSKLICGHRQTDSRVNTKRLKTENGDIEVEKQSRETDSHHFKIYLMLQQSGKCGIVKIIDTSMEQNSPEIHQHEYSQLSFDREAQEEQKSKDCLFNIWCYKTGNPQGGGEDI